MTVWFTVLVSMFPPPLLPVPYTHFFFFSDLDSLSKLLTKELKIRDVGFVLKKLFTHFEMLIVSHALHCVNGHYLYSISFDSLLNYFGLNVR